MKKTTYMLVIAMMTATSLSLGSCSDNKAGKADTTVDEAATVTTVRTAAEDSRPELTEAQIQAFVGASLLTRSDFSKAIFIDFNATWCGPCKQFAPYFEEASKTFEGQASFVAVDVDNYPAVAEAFGIESIPTVIAVTPTGKYDVYVGTTDLVGDGKFESIVKSHIE